MDINELTIGDVKKLNALIGNKTDDGPYQTGTQYFIRTVTHYFTGRCVAVYPGEIVLEDVAWIADTGRYSVALKTGDFSEVEPYPDTQVIINRGAVVDASVFPHTLPSKVK